MPSSIPRLSVNLNKVALLRNSRRTGVPDLLRFAAIAREAGAGGITFTRGRTSATSVAMTSSDWPN
jgi:pyridoxine 5'-phosphate synthase PdxJ